MTRVEHPYIEHEQFPEDAPDMSGVTKLLHKSFTDSIIRLMSQIENKSTIKKTLKIKSFARCNIEFPVDQLCGALRFVIT